MTADMEHTITMQLPCELTEDELRERGKTLANLIRRRTSAKDDLAEFRTEITNDIKGFDKGIEHLSRVICAEAEERSVDVTISRDFDANTKTWVRDDTGEEVRLEEIPVEERQQQLEGMAEAMGEEPVEQTG